MKKIILLAIYTLSLSALFAETSLVLTKSAVDTTPTLNVEVKSDTDVYGIQFDILFDSDELFIEKAESKLNMEVYSKVKKDGVLTVLMFDVSGNKIHDSGSTLTDIITLPFTAKNAKDVSTLVEFDNVIVAGYNGKDLDASFENFSVEIFESLPTTTTLSKNYPNPFNPSTTIEYSVANRGHVSIVVYDLNGAEVKTLVNEFKPESNYSIDWDGKNNSGQSVASGQYFYVMSAAGGFTSTQYMTLLK